MALVDSLLSAIVRADGDALVMHVGERPYVVVGMQTINISTHGLNLDAMTGMLGQLLPAESHTQLEEFGAVEYRIPQQGEDRFSVVAARGGDDIWIEIRRRRPQPVVAAAPLEATPAAAVAAPPPAIAEPAPSPKAPLEAAAVVAAEAIAEPVAEAVPEPEPVVEVAPLAEIAPEPTAEIPVPVAEIVPEPVVEVVPEPVAEVVPGPEPIPDATTELLAESMPVPVFAREMPALHSAAREGGPVAPVAELAPQAPEAPQAPQAPEIAEPVVEEPAYATAYDPILSEVEEPAPYVIEDTAVFEDTMAPVSAEAPAADTAFVEAVATEPIAEEPAPLAALSATPPVEEPLPIAASIETAPVAAAAHQPAPEPGVVLPMTRTVRIEVPPRTQSSSPSHASTGIDRLLRVAAARGASALFLTSDSRPWIRVEGDLRYLDSEAPLSRADVESAILEITPESGQESIGGEATEWLAEFEGVGRIRCTTFSDHRGPGVLLRIISTRAATAEQLGLAREVQELATEPQGLVLVAGPRASGKSTLISALVDIVNRQRAEYVISLERQIRLVHDNRLALVSQREIRGSADDSVIAARAALRENPDVLVVDDLVSPHMVPLLLTAASEGLLIFVSITAPSTADAVARFVELAPPEMRKAVQNAMAESFRGAVAQVLLKKAGGGLVAAREVLLATAPVTRVIGEGQLGQLPLTLESGRKHGMVSFTDALADYVRSGTVDVREAFRKAPDRNRLLETLKRDGVDTSVVERLA